jgi:hypothetical protein
MKFYSVHRTTEAGASAGYEWFTSKRKADAAATKWRTDNPDETATVGEWEIEPTKAGILAALNLHASHPDNG